MFLTYGEASFEYLPHLHWVADIGLSLQPYRSFHSLCCWYWHIVHNEKDSFSFFRCLLSLLRIILLSSKLVSLFSMPEEIILRKRWIIHGYEDLIKWPYGWQQEYRLHTGYRARVILIWSGLWMVSLIFSLRSSHDSTCFHSLRSCWVWFIFSRRCIL